MSAPALVERPLLRADSPDRIGRTGAHRASSERSGGGGLTLEQRLDSVWEGLRADGAADCPVCRGQMTVSPGGSTASCGDCRARLS